MLYSAARKLNCAIRLKDVRQEQYTQREADLGAGKTREEYVPAHPTEATDTIM